MDTERSFEHFSGGNRSLGFYIIVPIWIGVRRLPARQSKAIEPLLRIPSSRFQIDLIHRQSRLPAFPPISSRGFALDSLPCYTRTFKKRSQVKTQSRCFAVSKKQKQNRIQAFPSSKSTGYLRHSRGFCRVSLSRTCKGPSLASRLDAECVWPAPRVRYRSTKITRPRSES
jgi:hypothetical protein